MSVTLNTAAKKQKMKSTSILIKTDKFTNVFVKIKLGKVYLYIIDLLSELCLDFLPSLRDSFSLLFRLLLPQYIGSKTVIPKTMKPPHP